MPNVTRRTVRDYYRISIPGDFGTETEICEQAVTEARERARLYVMPAEWAARIVSGTVGDYEVTVLVTRRRYR
jgi:flavin-binding protein dodecin